MVEERATEFEETEEMTAEQRAPSGQPAQATGNIVYVSKKGVMAYVLAVVTQFNAGAKEVTLKARGKVISRAVDAAEIVKNKFLNQKHKNIYRGYEDCIWSAHKGFYNRNRFGKKSR